ncbi:hypothetical protein PoB_004134100 [Plakobranchus ocellatus]|uniref:Uncharacterized protein n=1 Tax=Plakobranchus ocellatus TaxID=259542 RepID=A0AAV4B7Q2_9GAST|nr:hypothetical protein PoB_004134100 [Plakobranchus ocellatus]
MKHQLKPNLFKQVGTRQSVRKKSDRKPEFFHESRESPPVWGTRNFTACSKRPGTSLGRSSGESPWLGRCVQVEKTKRLDWCAAIAGALPPQPHGRCGLGLMRQDEERRSLLNFHLSRDPFACGETLRCISTGLMAEQPVNSDTDREIGHTLFKPMKNNAFRDHTLRKNEEIVIIGVKLMVKLFR